ncbi:ribonuclease P protein subunit p30 [Tribolium castaneum]|uniref:Ribonuclease P protein subunit p30-like Protein n=1 Tax=Tribolium castaneum TaxID=7070 RepID=A0A139WH93_TRICA|nr:PREDICTED: ribonuclease P protein subunit p30 [Tribolium castaneum]KYB27157.1 Ribonuclease P protein subunit p30-like Protein [Tribolium castaneum]|eukprot:XP_008193663.1 PREDICTED: ribonuclease P protein subunit p30 [Tribolium castaneum]
MKLEVRGFFDYGVSEHCLDNNKYESTIKLLYDFGYRTIAINQTIDANELEQKKKKKKGELREGPSDFVPEPYKITPLEGYEDLTILNRLTIIFSNQDVMHKITKSSHYKKYHIIAVLPETVQANAFVCSSFEADILCFRPENKNHIKRSRKMYKQLIDRGYHFEIPYAPAIEDAALRRNIIHMAHLYHIFIKSRNVIVSSLAERPSLLRGPYDIINLGLIFGLNEEQAKNSITTCGRKVFINSVGRKHGKAVMFAENVEKEESSNDCEIIDCVDESEEDMEIDQPALKKVKQ